jgi:hypothetical protein
VRKQTEAVECEEVGTGVRGCCRGSAAWTEAGRHARIAGFGISGGGHTRVRQAEEFLELLARGGECFRCHGFGDDLCGKRARGSGAPQQREKPNTA